MRAASIYLAADDGPAGGGPRLIQCAKLGQLLPGLAKPPYPGDIGQRIYDEVSQQGWNLWKEHAKILLNEYRLNLAMPEAQTFLFEQCEAFLFGEGAKVPEEFAAPGTVQPGTPAPNTPPPNSAPPA